MELCSPSANISPRISFSHYLQYMNDDVVQIQNHWFGSNSSGPNFEFGVNIRKSIDQDSSSADELFYEGKILPTQIKKSAIHHRGLSRNEKTLHEMPKSHTSCYETGDIDKKNNNYITDKRNSRSFWWFKSSSSLGYPRGMCLFPLLSRSKSTGSTTNVTGRQILPKQSHGSVTTTTSNKQNKHKHRPPLKTNYVSNYANGFRVNPILNVPSGNLFGLSSIFFNGNEKNKRK